MLINDPEYLAVVEQVKARINLGRQRAAQAITREGIETYWEVGGIVNQYKVWGNKFIPNLARDIQLALPGIRGYSERNLRYMSKLAATYPTLEVLQRGAAKLPWRHNQVLLDRVRDPEEREWYAAEALTNGWSRDILTLQIDTHLYQRQVTATKTTNYEERLPRRLLHRPALLPLEAALLRGGGVEGNEIPARVRRQAEFLRVGS